MQHLTLNRPVILFIDKTSMCTAVHVKLFPDDINFKHLMQHSRKYHHQYTSNSPRGGVVGLLSSRDEW